ncbi:MAG: hemolysin family protein [Lachnospiraceae bacterium]|nr:hemolysin family protein [Lachnospiraceae bacterium]
MDTVPLSFIIIIILIIVASFAGYIFYYRKRSKNEYTEEDVISMVAESQEQGNILASEAEMIQNIFEFDEKDAKDIMINRTNIISIDGESTFRETIDCFNENNVSRIPVYMDDLDNIIGIVHIKEVLKYSTDPSCYDKKLHDFPELMYPAEFVPETHGINTLFTQMQLKKSHMVIVVDEYGQTSGIVTMEDILEEIVGNILDEHDEEEQNIREVRPDTFLMNGGTELSEAGQTLGLDLENEEFETLNGYLTNKIGRVPDEHEHFTVEDMGFRFDVLDVKNRIIQDVRVSKIEDSLLRSE